MIEVEMTSLDIAELTGKKHKHINETIRKKLLPSIEIGRDFDPSIFSVKSGTYTDKSNRTQNMFILNRNSANALIAYYDITFACKLVCHLDQLEKEIEEQQRQLDIMKDIVWEVINGQAYLSQEQSLKMAGIKHPRLFMKYLKSNERFYSSVVYERNILKHHQCNAHGGRWWKFTKEGFQWLLEGKDKLNKWVEVCKEREKQSKLLPH